MKLTLNEMINYSHKMHFSREFIERFPIKRCENFALLLDSVNLEESLLAQLRNFISILSKQQDTVDLYITQYSHVFLTENGKTFMKNLTTDFENLNMNRIEEDTLLTCLSEDKSTPFLLFPVKGSMLPSVIVNSKHRGGKTYLITNIENDMITAIDIQKYIAHLSSKMISMEESHERNYEMPRPQNGEKFYLYDSNGVKTGEFTYEGHIEKGKEAIIAKIPHQHPQKLAKIYITPRSSNELKKLSFMLKKNTQKNMQSITGFEAWPQFVVCDCNNYVRGYSMNIIDGIPLKMTNKGANGFRDLFPDNDKLDLIYILIAFLRTEILAQNNGYYKVDNNPGNFALADTIAPIICHLDIDSGQIANYASQTISAAAENGRRQLISTQMTGEMSSGLITARMASFIDTLTVWNLLFFATSPFTNDGLFWGKLSSTERSAENELLAATYSWFPKELRKQFALNLDPKEKTPSLIPLYLILKKWANELEKLPEDHQARLLIPESFNPNDAQWDSLIIPHKNTNIKKSSNKDSNDDTIIFRGSEPNPNKKASIGKRIKPKRYSFSKKDKGILAVKFFKTMFILGTIVLAFFIYTQLGW